MRRQQCGCLQLTTEAQAQARGQGLVALTVLRKQYREGQLTQPSTHTPTSEEEEGWDKVAALLLGPLWLGALCSSHISDTLLLL